MRLSVGLEDPRDVIADLDPTSPLRDIADIDACLDMLDRETDVSFDPRGLESAEGIARDARLALGGLEGSEPDKGHRVALLERHHDALEQRLQLHRISDFNEGERAAQALPQCLVLRFRDTFDDATEALRSNRVGILF